MKDQTPEKYDMSEDADLDRERKKRMRDKLLAHAGQATAVVRADVPAWRDFLPGVEIKLLHQDKARGIQTALWRMAAGSRIPPHPHSQDEECYLLEGSLDHDGQRYFAGDYMLARAGSRHGAISSQDGALMLIRGEQISARGRFLLRASLALGR